MPRGSAKAIGEKADVNTNAEMVAMVILFIFVYCFSAFCVAGRLLKRGLHYIKHRTGRRPSHEDR
jgi:hypothetical protein